MKNMYRATRPAWANMDKAETTVILLASVFLGIYGGWGERIAASIFAQFGVPKGWIHSGWPIVDVIVVTIGCLVLISIYKKIRVGCYPSTFIYCFLMPEVSNPSGKSRVVGYCHIKPDMDKGEITAKGASFFWENENLNIDSGVGFTSALVRCTKDKDEEVTCHIHFDINSEDWEKRTYHHGVLQFQLANNTAANTDKDTYAGYLQSHQKELELQEVEVLAKGYAEWHKKGCVAENEIYTVLEKNGEMLFAKLNAMLSTPPLPPLWKTKEHMSSNKANIWGHHIPTPQAVILNPKLRTYINGYLSKVLALFGLKDSAIERFQSLAVQTAKKEQDDTLVAYERDLKAGLIGQTIRHSEDEALTHRAEIIYEEIKSYFVGDSLLDIGCGNGLISSLAQKHFKQVQLLDVVEYVPRALNLSFMPYTEGHQLPINESFDTVLLLTVLHHSNDAVELLKLAWKATKKRLIIIESVVGIHQVTPPARYELATLNDEDQIGYAAFIDWFYNRVLHDDIPVPYNFTTVDIWESIFSKNKMRLVRTIHLGQDIEIGPEYHILFVLEKE